MDIKKKFIIVLTSLILISSFPEPVNSGQISLIYWSYCNNPFSNKSKIAIEVIVFPQENIL